MKHQGDNMASVKRYNRSVILKLLHQHSALSRKRIAEMMSLTPAAITMIVSEMIAEGLLKEGSADKSGGLAGRKEIPIMIAQGGLIALGVSINLNELVLSATDIIGRLLFSEIIPFENGIDPETIVGLVAGRLPSLIEENKLNKEKVMGIGITVRGIVDMDRNTSINSFGVLSGKDIPLAAMIHERFGCPARMDNNVRGMFRAHLFFSQQMESGVFFVRCEKGIGAAIMADNHILNGSSGMCSEFGHIPVVLRGGKPCKCGNRGCLETVASPTAVMEEVEDLYSVNGTPHLYALTQGKKEAITLQFIMKAAELGDITVAAAVQEAAVHLSSAIKAVVYTLDPKQVVLYGSMFVQPYYMESLHKHLAKGFDDRKGNTSIFISPFNLQLEYTAAPVLAINAFFTNGGYLSGC
jgi:predicted NBD/HSP70 family sugar kinase